MEYKSRIEIVWWNGKLYSATKETKKELNKQSGELIGKEISIGNTEGDIVTTVRDKALAEDFLFHGHWRLIY